jgi:hypothetical protein
MDQSTSSKLTWLPGEDIWEVHTMPGNVQGPSVSVNALFLIVPVFVILHGICSLLWPRMIWFLAEGWKFKNAEPSGCALAVIRVGGLVGLTVGTALLAILLRAQAH